MNSRTLSALKKLMVKITTASAVADVTGETVDEVLSYAESHFKIAEANALVLKDTDGAVYDVTVSTKGVLSATPRAKVANPTFSPASGTFSDTVDVELACATSGASIYYTTDGSDPTKESSVYSEAITLSATTTIKAFADKAAMTDSEIVSKTYTKSGS